MPAKRRNKGKKAHQTKALKFPNREDILKGEEFPRAGGKTIYQRKHYTSGRVYIVDDHSGRASTSTWGITVADPHASKCSMIRSCFEKSSPYSVVSVPTFDSSEEWKDWWENEATAWTKRELITVYYHGNAGQNDKRYTWFLTQGGFNVNAFNFINQLIETGQDIVLILECYVPTRFKNKSVLKKALFEHGNSVEIYAAGRPGQSDDNTPFTNDFTDRLLKAFYDLIHDEIDLRNASLKGWSVNEILRSDKEIHNNPLKMELAPVTPKPDLRRIIDKKTKKGEPKETIKHRIAMDKHFIRRHSRLSFCRDTIEDTMRQRMVDKVKERAEKGLPTTPVDLGADWIAVWGDDADWEDEGFAEGEDEADKGGEEDEDEDDSEDDEEGEEAGGMFC